MGRAARHIDGKVIMYADRMTKSMKAAIDEVDRRREYQLDYNKTQWNYAKADCQSIT
jgi:excinuclease ABC subunit B